VFRVRTSLVRAWRTVPRSSRPLQTTATNRAARALEIAALASKSTGFPHPISHDPWEPAAGTMAFPSMDALQFFTSIRNNVPAWITGVADLAAHTARKHAEFAEEYQQLTQTGPARRRRKSCSVHSIRPASEWQADLQLRAESPRPDEQGSRFRRMRDLDAASIVSAEGAPVFRMRHNLVIYYDSHTQQELEKVVREIGTARNCIRKSKMSQMMRKPSMGIEMFATRRANGEEGRTGHRSDQESAFDVTDKQLEVAQSLCEAAAHQFLRCGDCATELESIQEKFHLVVETATKEVSRLRADKEPAVHADEHTEVEGSPATPMEAITKPIDALEDGKPPEPGAAAIEVDDSASESSVSIDITAFRSSRFRS
jgi:hypothetical protein